MAWKAASTWDELYAVSAQEAVIRLLAVLDSLAGGYRRVFGHAHVW